MKWIILLAVVLGAVIGFMLSPKPKAPDTDKAQLVEQYRQQNIKLSNELKISIQQEQLLKTYLTVLNDSLTEKNYENKKLNHRLAAIKPKLYKPTQLDSLWASRYPQ